MAILKRKKRDAAKELSLAIAEAFQRVDSDVDFNQLGADVCQAIAVAYLPSNSDDAWFCIKALYPDRVVYEAADGMWQCHFTLDANHKPQLTDRTPVKTEYVAESHSLHSLHSDSESRSHEISESVSGELTARQSSEKGFVWDVQIVREGLTTGTIDLTPFSRQYPEVAGKRGRRDYVAESLQQAVRDRKFELAPLILRSDEEHQAYQKGQRITYGVNEETEKMGGVFDKTYIAESWDDPTKIAIRAKLRLKTTDAGRAMRDFLTERVAEGATIPYELSWTGEGKSVIDNPRAAEPTIRVTEIVNVVSVDPTIRGNAGGYIMRASESTNPIMDKKLKNQLLLKYGALCYKNPKVARIAEAADAEGDAGGGGDVDIELKVAQAYLADNPGVAEYVGSAEEFLKNPKAGQLLSKWLDEELAETTPDGNADAEEGADTTAVAESFQNIFRAQKKTAGGGVAGSALEQRLVALEKENADARKRIVESHLENALSQSKNLPPNTQQFIRNVVKNSGLADTTKIDEMIRDASKSLIAESAHINYSSKTPDEQDKWRAAAINLSARYARPEVKKRIAETLGYNPFERQYQTINSLKEMLRVFDGVEASHMVGGFGISPQGRISESFDAGITSQIAFDAMHVILQAEWEVPEIYDDWRKFTRISSASDFRPVNTENFGYFNSANIVERTDQTQDYAELPLTGAENAPYSIKDYGLIFSLYWKDFVNDNVGKFQRLPHEMSNVFKRKIYNLVMDLVWAAPFTTWPGTEDNGSAMVPSTKKICDATGWGNAPATPSTLSYTSLIEGFTGLMKAPQLGSDAVTGVISRYLLTPMKTWQTAYNLTQPLSDPGDAMAAATTTGLGQLAARGITALKSAALPLEHVMVPYWDGKGATFDRFFLLADPMQQECLNVFLYSNISEPLLMQEATATGKSFSADAIRFKEHFPFNAGFVNARGIWGNAAS